MRGKIIIALSGIAIATGLAINAVTAIAQQPASAAQLSAWESQKASLLVEQRKAQSERAALPGQQRALQAEITRIQKILDGQTLAGAATEVGGKTVIQGANPFDKRTQEERAMDNAWAAVKERNALKDLRDQKKAELERAKTRQAQLDAEIPARADQIAQLDRTIAYNRNPLQSELDNQNERLENYKRQRRPGPDPGLDADISDAERRIKELNELQKQFQEGGGTGGPSTGGASRGQPQPQSYNAPSAPPDGGPQLQVPPLGYVPGYIGVPPVYGAAVPPRWTDLNPPPRQRPGGPPHAGPDGPPSPPPPIAQAPGGTKTPPASGGDCREPLCYYAGQEKCEKGPLPNEDGWLPACYENMNARCDQGMAGGTGATCVHKGADPSCAVRARRVCGGG